MTTDNKEQNEDAIKALRKMKHPKLTFGRMLRSIRMRDEITQIEFAKKLGITKQDLSNIETGRTTLSVNRAKNFAKKLKESEEVFIKILLQDILDKEGINVKIEFAQKAS